MVTYAYDTTRYVRRRREETRHLNRQHQSRRGEKAGRGRRQGDKDDDGQEKAPRLKGHQIQKPLPVGKVTLSE